MKGLSDNCLFFDIEPEHKDIIKQDFLESHIEKVAGKPLHFIGNPPFGRQSSLARKFIKKCCTMDAASISFILPKSFKKESFQRAFSLHYHMIFQYDIPENGFNIQKKTCDVPCVFQIWVKKDQMRSIPEKVIPREFEFVGKDDADCSIRRVGVYAGAVYEDCNKSVQSHYFIRFTNNKPIMENIERLQTMQFDFDNTVGPRSLSKQELIVQMNEKL